MRYTLAAFGIMASAVFASPMALHARNGQNVNARGTATTDAVNWNDYGYSSSSDWKKKGGVRYSGIQSGRWLLAPVSESLGLQQLACSTPTCHTNTFHFR